MNFKVINSSKNYGIDNLISEEYQKVIKKGNDNYASIQEEWYEGAIDELLNYCNAIGGHTVLRLSINIVVCGRTQCIM